MTKELYVFYQSDGDNTSNCNLKCPYCYQQKKRGMHEWNGKPLEWEAAFERLGRDIYFNVCHGEPMLSEGFTDVIDMIGRHPNWECNLITNLTQSPTKLIQSQVAKDGRLYVIASWHPLTADWEVFKKHILELQAADIKTVVMFIFYPPQIEQWKQYFPWFDEHNIRTYVRRFYGYYEHKLYPQAHTEKDKQFLKAMANHPWTIKYCVNMANPRGQTCYATVNKILVHSDGRVSNCADVPLNIIGNLFDPDFKLPTEPVKCPYHICGGDHGLFHMIDPEITVRPGSFKHDSFIIYGAGIKGGGKEPVFYPNRSEMNKWLTT